MTHYEDAVELALERTRDSAADHSLVAPRATKTSPSRPLPTDPEWAGGALHEQVSERRVDADAETLWQVFESIGAEHGWSAAPPAWALRGWTGRIAGAAKTERRLRTLHAGEALDWWRVEHIDRPQLLRLRADVPLPGRLWLELSVHGDGGGRCRYRQRWCFSRMALPARHFGQRRAPFRDVVFGGIARDIASSGTAVPGRSQFPAKPERELRAA